MTVYKFRPENIYKRNCYCLITEHKRITLYTAIPEECGYTARASQCHKIVRGQKKEILDIQMLIVQQDLILKNLYFIE